VARRGVLRAAQPRVRPERVDVCGRLVDEQATAATPDARADAKLLLDVLTPIAKSWPSQWCLEANSLAIQVLGGAGYTRDYDVEQHYRDNRLNPIHEGTHGIQAMDLLGRKALGNNGAGLLRLQQEVRQTVERADALRGEPAELAGELRDLEAAGHIVLAWIWLEQLLAAEGGSGAFYDGKRQAARYFFRWELPRVFQQLELLASGDENNAFHATGMVLIVICIAAHMVTHATDIM
jgi:hypothetical protein